MKTIKPTLLILAAGMGSRYGGLKQLDPLGPSGETIMDYSIFDAIEAGFGKVIFVIRKCFEADFTTKIISKYEKHIPVQIVFQELDNLPRGYNLDPQREKPWGTNHAILVAKDIIKEPFAVINADDYYGKSSFETLAKELNKLSDQKNHYCMVAYKLKNTLSESGAVSRGVCELDQNNFLKNVVERTHIVREDKTIKYKNDSGLLENLSENALVSMNMWGFTPDYFQYSEQFFKDFLDANKGNLKAEYYIPSAVDKLIQTKQADVKVYSSSEHWFGVTYPEDRAGVVSKIQTMVNAHIYPSPLWQNE